jgi:hypothetical protein
MQVNYLNDGSGFNRLISNRKAYVETSSLDDLTAKQTHWRSSKQLGATGDFESKSRSPRFELMQENEPSATIPLQNPRIDQQRAAVLLKRASLCPVAWSKMSGDEKVRWCEPCKHFTYNRQKESVATVLSWIWFREGIRPSVLYVRADGAVMTADCKAGARTTDLLRLGKIVAGIAGPALVLAMLTASAPQVVDQPSASVSASTSRMALKKGKDVESASKLSFDRRHPAIDKQGMWVVPNLKSTPAAELPSFEQLQAQDSASPRAESQPNSAAGGDQSEVPSQNSSRLASQTVFTPVTAVQQKTETQEQSKPALPVEPQSEVAVVSDQPAQPDKPNYVWDARVSAVKR